MTNFAYIGKPLTADQFVAYVQAYNFGSIKPDQLVIHNSANPDASWAPLSADPGTKWDRDEAGLSEAQIKFKRKLQLDAIMRFYRDALGWSAGPHLFVDERWIWLFTPMYDVGVHAAEANSYKDAAGHLHYTIGIETIGWFGKVGWPGTMQQLLRTTVQTLRARLKTFEIVYKEAPRHRPELHQGSIAFHRDYNKAACPGAVITPEYAIPILAGAPPPLDRQYRVKALATAGATIRAAPSRQAAVLGRLHAGDVWIGEAVRGETVTIAGFGSSDVWIMDKGGRCVWSNLLETI